MKDMQGSKQESHQGKKVSKKESKKIRQESYQ